MIELLKNRAYKEMFVDHMWEVDVLDDIKDQAKDKRGRLFNMEDMEARQKNIEKRVNGLYKQYYREQFFSKICP